MVDTAGFPKDAFYVVQAAWLDPAVQPMVHLFPYWDWNPGQTVDVCACTNAASVELFLDGESLGPPRAGPRQGAHGGPGRWLTAPARCAPSPMTNRARRRGAGRTPQLWRQRRAVRKG